MNLLVPLPELKAAFEETPWDEEAATNYVKGLLSGHSLAEVDEAVAVCGGFPESPSLSLLKAMGLYKRGTLDLALLAAEHAVLVGAGDAGSVFQSIVRRDLFTLQLKKVLPTAAAFLVVFAAGVGYMAGAVSLIRAIKRRNRK